MIFRISQLRLIFDINIIAGFALSESNSLVPLSGVRVVVRRYATGISASLSPSLLKMKVHAGPASTRSVRVWNFFLGAPAGPPWPNVRRIVSSRWRLERQAKKLALAANARLENIDLA